MRHKWINNHDGQYDCFQVCSKCGVEWDASFGKVNSEAKCPNTRNWRTAAQRLLRKNGVLILHIGPSIDRWQNYFGGSIFPGKSRNEGTMEFSGVEAIKVIVGREKDTIKIFDYHSVTVIENWRDIRRMSRFPDDECEIIENYTGTILKF